MKTGGKIGSAKAQEQYDVYVRGEWDLFDRNPVRAQASLEAVRELRIKRVLDIGCGAGQELLPFVVGQRVLGIGLDHAPAAGRAGRQLFAKCHTSGRVVFIRGSAEKLPFRSEDVDLIICRLALPYTRNAQALSEMARVLRPGGVILLKIHHARFYLNRMKKAAAATDLRRVAHAARVLVAGIVYHVTGRQPNNWLMGSESFQSERLLRRELSRYRLAIREVMPDSNPRTPSYALVKEWRG